MICLALILATEAFLYSSRAYFMEDFWNKFIVNERELVNMPGDFDYLIIGDSLQKTGINTALVSDRVLNLGLPGSKPLGQYLLLKNYLEKHKPPKAVFFYMDPEDTEQSILVILRYFVSFKDFLSIWPELTWKERKYFITRYWESMDLRTVGAITRDWYRGPNDVFIGEMKKNLGYLPSSRAGRVMPDDRFRKTKERYASRISMTEQDHKYLDKFIELAEENKIKVVFLGQLLPKELYDIFERSGFNADYLRFLEDAKRRYPGAYFVDEPIVEIDNSMFGDISHVNTAGAKFYTEYFKDKIFKPYSEMFDKEEVKR